MKKLLGLLMLFAFAAVMAHAAESTSAQGNAQAKVIAAATITHQDGALDFGTIFKNTTGGSVTVQPAAAPAPTYSNVTPAGSTSTSSDHFLMENLDSGTTYTVALSSPSIDIQRTGGDETMGVALTLSDTSVSSATTKDIYVGGTLTVGANQAVGEYLGHYNVNVTY